MKPYIIDTTLRDGEQAPGVVFNLKEKIRIAKMLDMLGVQELEIGTPAMGTEEVEQMSILTSRKFGFRTSAWCRAVRSDIDMASKTGVEGVNISFPVSDIQLSALGKEKNWVFDHLKDLILYARQHFNYVSIGAQDASRADKDFLFEFIERCRHYNVYRIRIADTVGLLNPIQVEELVSTICRKFPGINLEFHAHNDFGMATANSIIALQSGARCVSATVNGLGERAGNAALEEIIMALNHTCNLPQLYNASIIYELCNSVAKASGRTIPVSKSIVGETALKHETGIHVKSILSNRYAYQPFPAAEIGRGEDEFVYGKHSGSAAIRNLLSETGIHEGMVNVSKLAGLVREHSANLKRALKKNEILALLNTSMNHPVGILNTGSELINIQPTG